MLRFFMSVAAFSAFLLAGDAAAASPFRPAPAPAAPSGPGTMRPIPNPPPSAAKQRACEQAWQRQRIKKGSRKAFIRACVRHG